MREGGCGYELVLRSHGTMAVVHMLGFGLSHRRINLTGSDRGTPTCRLRRVKG